MIQVLRKFAISADPVGTFRWMIMDGTSKVGELGLRHNGRSWKNPPLPIWDMEIWVKPLNRGAGIATVALENFVQRLEGGELMCQSFPSQVILRAVTNQSNAPAMRLFKRAKFLKTEEPYLGEVGEFAPEIWIRPVFCLCLEVATRVRSI